MTSNRECELMLPIPLPTNQTPSPELFYKFRVVYSFHTGSVSRVYECWVAAEAFCVAASV